ncbi:DUF6545 domain-containing protein [Prauserella muralis]|uniref:DUF6545 domain-containing protein n=1 Tax=Prauserella muralis TaxID=588067 RepID=A0A2V4ADM6_9PSEU|nr:DUF6545 domain-containing protein [Prauserella muralis]PXY16600.1 hypothetical protein BAY60_36010 [Prauserella muralis]TWE11154.1 hypothetical protein FHX69_7373 [Prauserella muralis]
MIDLLFLTVGAATLLLGAARLLQALRHGRPRGVGIAGVAFGGALLTLAPLVQQLESQLYPSLGRLVSNLFTLTAAYGLLVTASDLAAEQPSHTRRCARFLSWLAAETVLVVCFFATPDLPQGLGLFGHLYRTEPTMLAYIATFTVYFTVAVADATRVTVAALPPARGPLRKGMVTLLVACGLFAVYVIGKTALIVNSLVTTDTAEPFCRHLLDGPACLATVTAPILAVFTGVLALVLSTAGLNLAARRAIRDLTPLHQAIVERVPTVRRDLRATTTRDRLVRAVVEIDDGLLALGISPGPPEHIAQAVRRAQPGTTGHPTGPAGASQPGDVWSEVEQLRPIARAYTRLHREARV